MMFPAGFAEATMQRALELGRRGLGRVEPNPPVGAVIVDESGQLVAEGWHQQFGGPHAEVHALGAAGRMARGATLFVTLEPCCHFGKTPPCSDAIIAAGIRRVIVAIGDPAIHVNGGGIRALRNAGIEVEVGLLQAEARRLVAPFVQLSTQGRPWFHAKWGMSLDGKIASRTGHSRWITSERSREVVHQLRGRMDAILIGIGTALADDPLLIARPAGPRIATRIILDSQARLPLTSQLVQTVAQAPVLVVTAPSAPAGRCEALRAADIEVTPIISDATGRPQLTQVAMELGRRRMTNVLVEGGGELLGAFFDQQRVDEVHAFVAPKLIGGIDAKTSIAGHGLEFVPAGMSLDEPTIEVIDRDIYVHGQVRKDSKKE